MTKCAPPLVTACRVSSKQWRREGQLHIGQVTPIRLIASAQSSRKAPWRLSAISLRLWQVPCLRSAFHAAARTGRQELSAKLGRLLRVEPPCIQTRRRMSPARRPRIFVPGRDIVNGFVPFGNPIMPGAQHAVDGAARGSKLVAAFRCKDFADERVDDRVGDAGEIVAAVLAAGLAVPVRRVTSGPGVGDSE